MKKANLISILSLAVVVVLLIVFWKTSGANAGADDMGVQAGEEVPMSTPAPPQETISSETDMQKTEAPAPEKPEPSDSQIADIVTAPPPQDSNPTSVSMEDALFIGDSRTVGLCEYAEIGGADFFANVGMSVYNIHNKPVSVPSVGKVTLSDLLQNKKYGKIYIMLGINEVGYDLCKTVDKYSELIAFIQERQTDARIFIQANLCVTKSRSDTDQVINNTAIRALNTALSKLADGKKIFYLDVNTLFNDGSGNLPSDKSADSAHLYGKYYLEWGQWIVRQTAARIGEG